MSGWDALRPNWSGENVNLAELLHEDGPAIVDDAWNAVALMEHYRRDGEAVTRHRVDALYAHVVRAVQQLDLDGLLSHVRSVAQERFAAGFELSELRTAFVMLEESIYRRALARLPREDASWGLALVTTAFTQARLALGQTFVSLPAAQSTPVDLSVLFHRSERSRAPEDLVYPV
jgi:hypothetical protein